MTFLAASLIRYAFQAQLQILLLLLLLISPAKSPVTKWNDTENFSLDDRSWKTTTDGCKASAIMNDFSLLSDWKRELRMILCYILCTAHLTDHRYILCLSHRDIVIASSRNTSEEWNTGKFQCFIFNSTTITESISNHQRQESLWTLFIEFHTVTLIFLVSHSCTCWVDPLLTRFPWPRLQQLRHKEPIRSGVWPRQLGPHPHFHLKHQQARWVFLEYNNVSSGDNSYDKNIDCIAQKGQQMLRWLTFKCKTGDDTNQSHKAYCSWSSNHNFF